jgi:hypothetical protein
MTTCRVSSRLRRGRGGVAARKDASTISFAGENVCFCVRVRRSMFWPKAGVQCYSKGTGCAGGLYSWLQSWVKNRSAPGAKVGGAKAGMRAVRVALEAGGSGTHVGHLAVVDMKQAAGGGVYARLITCHMQDIWLPLDLEGTDWQELEQCPVRVAYLEDEDSTEPTMFDGRITNIDTNEMAILVEFEDSQSEWVSLIEDDWEWADMGTPEREMVADAVRRRGELPPFPRNGASPYAAVAAGSSSAGRELESGAADTMDDDWHSRDAACDDTREDDIGAGSGDEDAGGRGCGTAGNRNRVPRWRAPKVEGWRTGLRNRDAPAAAPTAADQPLQGRQARESQPAESNFGPKFVSQPRHMPFTSVLAALREAAAADPASAQLLELRQMTAAVRTLSRAGGAKRKTDVDDWRSAAAWVRERCEAETRPLLELLHLNGYDRLVRRRGSRKRAESHTRPTAEALSLTGLPSKSLGFGTRLAPRPPSHPHPTCACRLSCCSTTTPSCSGTSSQS